MQTCRFFYHSYAFITIFGSVTIAVSRHYLRQLFGQINHPVVASVLEDKENIIFETSISAEMIKISSEFLHQAVPKGLESHFYKLECEELLCYTFPLLMQREAFPASNIHIDDIKAIYAIKVRLQSQLSKPPDIA